MTFYTTINADAIRPYIPDVPLMLPATSWARRRKGHRLRPVHLPPHLKHTAADCGGFIATRIWGHYPFSPQEYVSWLYTFTPRWAATMDYCCEDELTSGLPGVVAQRQLLSTRMALHFWQQHPNVPWTWVPTVQGWTTRQYARHARELLPLVRAMAAYYDHNRPGTFRVGIGTLCRRDNALTILEVTDAVAAVLGPQVPLHLWGVKLAAMRRGLPPQVRSVDSAAWNQRFGPTMHSWRKSGLSQREHDYTIALPDYLRKVEHALSRPRQLRLL